MVERFIHGRRPPDQALVKAARVCSLVYAFDAEDDFAGPEIVRLANLAEQTPQTFFGYVADLRRGEVVQCRGNQRALLPHAIANRLAEDALKQIPFALLEAQLVHGAPERLTRSFSRRLGYLDKSPEAQKIVRHWLQPGGILSEPLQLDDASAAMFGNVAPVLPKLALETLERALLPIGDRATLRNCARYSTVIRGLAFEPDNFRRCFALLAKIAIANTSTEKHNRLALAAVALFQIWYSGTNAPIDERIRVAEELLTSLDAEEQALGLRCLSSALETSNFQVSSYFDFGARSRSFGYWPRSLGEIQHCFQLVLEVCVALVSGGNPIASEVRRVVASQLRGLWIQAQMYDDVEKACHRIAAVEFWREGWVAIRSIQQFDTKELTPEASDRLAKLEQSLRPGDLIAKVRAVVFFDSHDVTATEDGSDGDPLVARRRADEVANKLGVQVATNPVAFHELLPEIPTSQGRLWHFGQGLAEGAHDPRQLWHSLAGQLARTPAEMRRFEILHGFLNILREGTPQLVSELLDNVVLDSVLATDFPALQAAGGIDQRGGARIILSLSLGLTPIENYGALARGGAIKSMPAREFRDAMLEIASKPGGFRVAIGLLTIRLPRENQANEAIEPETIEAGREVIRRVPFTQDPDDVLDHEMGVVSKFCLDGGPGQDIVAEVLSRFKKAAADYNVYVFYYNRLILGMFSAHPVAALNALCDGDSQELQMGCAVLGDLRQDPLAAVPTADLLAWCDQQPDIRYPGIASVMTILDNQNDPDRAGWTAAALRLLERAPDRREVLTGYGVQLELAARKSPPLTESLMKRLDGLAALYPDPLVIEFVADQRKYLKVALAARDRRSARQQLQEHAFEY